MISTELESVLRAAGWTQDRTVDIAQWMKEIEFFGFNIVPDAEIILRNFGGLTLYSVRRPTDVNAAGMVVFDPLLEAESDRVEDWQEQLGILLTPIGQFADRACLLVADDGAIYTQWSQFLWRRGTSLIDALENSLLFGRRKPVEMLHR